jgi:2'-5' RNA ligase
MNPRAVVFLALRVPGKLAHELMQRATDSLGGDRALRHYRLARVEGVHLTLFYLGDTARAGLESLAGHVRPAVQAVPRPMLRLGRGGAFPRRGRERVLWMGADEAPESGGVLASLRDAVLRAVSVFGVDTREESSRPFVPHITLARPRRGNPDVPEAFYAFELDGTWSPGAVELIESIRGAGAAVYRTLEEFPLADPE